MANKEEHKKEHRQDRLHGEASKYMPDYYNDVYEMVELMKAYDFVLGGFSEEETKILYNQFVLPADVRGVRIFEDQLSIVPEANQTLDERKQVILTRLMPPQPITVRFIRNLLKQLSLPVKFDVNYGKRIALLNGKISDDLTDKDALTAAQIRQLRYLMNIYLPANMGKNIQLNKKLPDNNSKVYTGGFMMPITKAPVKSDLIKVPDPVVKPFGRVGGAVVSTTKITVKSDPIVVKAIGKPLGYVGGGMIGKTDIKIRNEEQK